MLILADENFPLATVEAMRADGHDVLWVRTDCPGRADAALLERAEAQARLVLTLDKDFWQTEPRSAACTVVLSEDGLNTSRIDQTTRWPGMPRLTAVLALYHQRVVLVLNSKVLISRSSA
jgi:hypothetical protein